MSAKLKKPSVETVKALDGLRKEIIAGMVAIPKTDEDQVWNQCASRCIKILDSYKRGEGLFQK